MVALDMDGTFLNSHKAISEENKAAVQEWATRGAKIVLASGRMVPALQQVEAELGVDCYTLGYNGAQCAKPQSEAHELVFDAPVPLEVTKKIIAFCKEGNHYANLYINGKLYGVRNESRQSLPDTYGSMNSCTYTFLDSYEDAMAIGAPSKVLVIARSEEERNEIHEKAIPLFAGEPVKMTRTHSYTTLIRQDYLEFTHKTVNKGTGLRKLCAAIGVDIAHTVAFGDADNDAEMLEVAGYGICMRGGSELAQRLASGHVSRWNNDDHAVAKELDVLAKQLDAK